MLLCGTHDGVYRVDALPASEPRRVLDSGRVWELRAAPDTVYAATDAGLYRSTDSETWSGVSLDDGPTAVLPAEAGVLVGTDGLSVLRGEPGGQWPPVGDLAIHPHGERWRDRASGDGPTVRSLAVHPGDGVLAGIEPGGVYAFDGDVWRQYGRGVHDDVHDLTGLEDGATIAATGDGLYRTDDGDRWYRLDTDYREFWATYFRETIEYGDELYASAYTWGQDRPLGAILSGNSNGGSFDRTPLPGDEPAYATAWVLVDGDLVAGTTRVDDVGFLEHEPAPLLLLENGNWTVAGEVPSGATSLAPAP